MALIESIYPTYVQKSKLFLYPALGIKRGLSESLIGTFMGYKNEIRLNENKLIALYYLREDMDFRMFESGFLTGNEYFIEKKVLPDNKAIYIFDFDRGDLKHNFKCVVNGKYSKITDSFKKVILEYYENNVIHHTYVHSFLYPDSYFELYAEFFITTLKDKKYIENLLRTVGELCSKPDLPKEILGFDPNYSPEKEFFIPLSGNQQ